MVDTAFRKAVRVEVVERAVLGEAQTSVCVRVVEYSRRSEDAVYLVVLVDIEDRILRSEGMANPQRSPEGGGSLD